MSTYTANTRTLTAKPRSKRMQQGAIATAQVVQGGGSVQGNYLPATNNGDGYDVADKVAFLQKIRIGAPDTIVDGVVTQVNGIDIEVDTSNGAVHVKGGLYADGFVSALGLGSGSGTGGGGMDLDSLWDALSTYDNEPSHVINSSYIPNLSGYLQKSGDTMTGNLVISESKNILLRTANTSYTAGIGYDTLRNECIALWAKNSVTRLRWHAGVDMTNLTPGTMMDITPDFEISKADGSAKGYIAGNIILHSNNYSSYALPLTGGTMTGVLTLKANQYSGVYGMNCSNSDLINVNAIITSDNAENFGEGIMFWRSSTPTYDCLTASGGTFYFGANKFYGATLTGDAAIDCGQIYATHIINIANGTYGSRLHMANSTQGTYFEIFRDAVDKIFFGYCDGNSHYQHITLSSNGNVGIGTGISSPTSKLHVVGNVIATGAVTALATSASDRRLKKDIKPFNAREIIDKLQPVEFRWNDEAHEFNGFLSRKELQHGLIAQDSDDIIDGFVFELGNGTDYKGIHYEKLTPILLQSVKEQQAEIDSLKAEVAELKDILKQLIKKIIYGSYIG